MSEVLEASRGDIDPKSVKSDFEVAVEKASKLSKPVSKSLELEGRLNSYERSRGALGTSRVTMPDVPHVAIDLEAAISNVLADPTDEQKRSWEGLSEEQKRDQIVEQIRSFAEERGMSIE